MPVQETGNPIPKNGARKKGRGQAAQAEDGADTLANGSDAGTGAPTDAPKDAPLLALAASDTPQATPSGSDPATWALSDSPRDAGQGMPWLLAAADSERDGDAERSADKPLPVPASGGSMGTALAVGAGLLLAAAAGGSGGGSSSNNSNNNNGSNDSGNNGGNNGGSTPPPGNTPSDPKPPIITPLALSIDQIAGDDVVNAAEKAAGVTVSGVELHSNLTQDVHRILTHPV